ncbi:MAG: DUF5801 repeats-in-toxin domain-containing protein, partial [Paracoccaceae bacterium]|nr:DUF5801 repeats-in-toxin domain-containing protein [Paracoccaceae bacterium]
SIITEGDSATLDVRANDTGIDGGPVTVTAIDGQPIAPGTPVSVTGGTVSIDNAGVLTFTPGPGVTGDVEIPYTLSDDGTGATDRAVWTVTVDALPSVDIVDNASPSDPAAGDDVLSSLDDLAAVAINGQVPGGGSLTQITVTDGTGNTVTIPAADVTIAPDGTFTVNADLSGLDDGTLTVSMDVTDRDGIPATVTDTIQKDTVTEVAINPITIVDGVIPTISGTGIAGETVTLTIDGGDPVTLVVAGDGTWSFTPAAPLPDTAVTVSSTATDPFGNTATDTRDVTPAIVEDQVPGAPEDILVSEANLASGTDPAAGGAVVTSTIELGTGATELAEITIGGTTLTAAQLDALDTTPVAPIATTYGTITVTDFDADTGTLTYDYELTGATDTHSAAGADIVRETIDITATDDDGDTRETTLVVGVEDDQPSAAVNTGFVGALISSDADLTTDPSLSFADAFDIDLGADGGAASNAVVYSLSSPDAVSGLTDQDTGAPIVLSEVGGEVVGIVDGGAANGEVAFTVSVDPATGVITLDQARTIFHGPGVDTVSIAEAGVELTATVADGDGDVTSESLEIGDRLSFANDIPVANAQAPLATVEDGATVGTANGAPNLLDNDIPGEGVTRVYEVTYTDDTGTEQTVTIAAGQTGTGPLAAEFGTLEVNADGSWSFIPDEEITHTDGAAVDAGFTYDLIDGPTNADTGSVSNTAVQPIFVEDTAPVAVDDASITVTEADGPVTGNVTDNDTASEDGPATLVSFSYTDASGNPQTVTFDAVTTSATVATPTGALTVNADGSWSFDPAAYDDDSFDADTGSFTYVLVDDDGSTSQEASQTIVVTDLDPATAGATLSLDEAALPGIGSDGATGADPSASQTLGVTVGADPITDVVFTQATIDGLPALTSGGETVAYAISPDGHTLTATAGGATVLTVTLDNPTDATGATQAVTATLSGPIDQAGALTELDFAYEVRDIDSTTSGMVSLTIADDAPLAPQDDPPVTVEEGAAAVGSASGGDNLLANDTLGADGGRLSSINYTDRSGTAVTANVPESGAATVDTQYGTLTVAADGTWSYTPVASADHQQPGSDTALSDDFTYVVTDGDGDESVAATQEITVTDTAPSFGTPEDATVSEASLPSGSDPDTGALTVTGALNLTTGQDAVETTLTGTPTGITSGGVALQYVTSADGRTVEAFAGDPATADRVFTLTVTDPTDADAGYSFTLEGPLDHGTDATLDLDFTALVTDSDDDTDSVGFTVTVADDAAPPTLARTISEDGDFTVNTSADATPANTVILQGGSAIAGTANGSGGVDYALANGTATVNADGTVTYVPAPNFSGTELFDIETTDPQVTTTTVTATVEPVSDAPTLGADDDVTTDEDVAVALGLNAPVIVDDASGAGNNTTSERIGPVTLTGLPEGAVLQDADGNALFTVGTDPVQIVISDVDTVDGATGDLTLSSAAYEALQVLPPPDASDNFTVTASATSFEVDSAGDPLSGVPGATTTQDIEVLVRAVTDDAALTFDTTAPAPAGTTGITYASATEATVSVDEDTAFDVQPLLEASFADLDGSEERALVITNNTGQPIVVNGATLAPNGTVTIDATGQTGDADSFPSITIAGGENVSGALNGIDIELVAQDVDADGFTSGSTAEADGLAEADTSNNPITLNLDLASVAGDVAEDDLGVTVAEDTAAAFLENIAVTDTNGTDAEVIDEVSFVIPDGWTFEESTVNTGIFTVTPAASAGAPTTITFTGGTEDEREAALDGFTLTPPAHSSLDATVEVSVTTTDGADTATVTRDVPITVTPVAEVEDGTSDDGDADDLSLTPGVVYTTPGQEDTWFDLNVDGFNLSAGWSNEDPDENTFALLTPSVGGGESAVGSQFRWTDPDTGDQVTQTFSGGPVQVPVAALDTVEFLPPPDVAGSFEIEVNALSQDFDDDDEGSGTPVESVSGQAFLTNVNIAPVADEVALTLTARARGDEDEEIPLDVRPSSSDTSETFNIEIEDIPVGATITYGATTFTATVGNTTFAIEDFDPDVDLTVTPPEDSNEDFDLTIVATSVDTAIIDGAPVTSVSAPVARTISVAVAGIADPVTVEVPVTPPAYVEEDLDGGATVPLSDLASFTQEDDDGSETLSVRVSGLPDGFSISGGVLVSPPSATGADRVWALSEAQFNTAQITVPDNFSGTQTLTVQPVSTENDGSSLTGTATTVSFAVTPSPEAEVTTSAVLVEDEITPLNLQIVPQNGDADETLESVRIRTDQAQGDNYTLYLGTDLLSDQPVTNVGGVDYYVLNAAEAADLAALADPQVDGDVGDFELEYQITDDAFGSSTGTGPVTGDFQTTTFSLSTTPVTDTPDATISAITAPNASTTTTITDDDPVDDADPDTVVLDAPDTVTVDLAVGSPDDDGSERVTRILIENVPQGVTVVGAEALAPGTWLLVYEGASTPQIDADGATVPVEFVVGDGVPTTPPTQIDMTVQVQDRGDQAEPGTLVQEDTVSWTIETTYGDSPVGEPADIDDWSYTGAGATEDVATPLSDLFLADISTNSTAPNTFTVQLTDVPEGTEIEGMTRTVIDGEVVYTAAMTTTDGDDEAAAQAALDALLQGITITAPPETNDNNTPGGLPFTATLNTTVLGGATFNSDTEDIVLPVTPVTDPASINIGLGPSDDDGTLDESDPSVPISIALSNTADGAAANIVDSTLYLQVDGSVPELQGGTFTGADGTTTYVLTPVSGVAGLPDGDYYVIPDTDFGDTVDVIYTPPETIAGDITVTAAIVNQETGADPITDIETQVLPIAVGNEGATLTSAPTTGSEAADLTNASLIQLAGLSATLNDDDGSEDFEAILLTNVPEGFVVYIGNDQASAVPADNAGGDGTTNTWVLSGPGEPLPDYVAILPPQNFSGTVTGMNLTAVTGETSLDETRTDEIAVGDVTITPVANGAEVAASTTFGTSGRITPVNLNVALVDNVDASTSIPDENQETATVVLTGLGE